mmetsp:Transcript_111376/g.294278  ORF Transcript_111376/g.294278 Transcript_111376/m.294278 type:complete len:244 (-) Transcript_111376:103-834(-)
MVALGAMAIADKRGGTPLWQLAEANRQNRMQLAQAKGRDAKELSPEVEMQRAQIASASKRRSDELRRELAAANQTFRARLDEVAITGGKNPIALTTRLEVQARPTLTDTKELSFETGSARENVALRSAELKAQREAELARENRYHRARVAEARAAGSIVPRLPDEAEAARQEEAERLAARRAALERELAAANRDLRARLAGQAGRDAQALPPHVEEARQRRQEELAAKWSGPRRSGPSRPTQP